MHKSIDGDKAYLNFTINDGYSSSDESNQSDENDDIGENVRTIIEKSKNENLRLGVVIKMVLYETASCVALVELNEKLKKQKLAGLIEQATSVFSFD